MENNPSNPEQPEGAVFTEAQVRQRIDDAISAVRQELQVQATAAAGSQVTAAAQQAAQQATAAERGRILAVYAACEANKAVSMFAGMVADGSTEQQANGRIFDALAMRHESNDISSRHGGGSARQGVNAREIYDSRR